MPLRITFVCILAGLGLLAQAPTGDVKVDTSQARAVIATLQPHQSNPAHEHPLNRVLVFLGPVRLTLTNPAGTVRLGYPAIAAAPAMGDQPPPRRSPQTWSISSAGPLLGASSTSTPC